MVEVGVGGGGGVREVVGWGGVVWRGGGGGFGSGMALGR